jgi:hypothetical protein
MRPANYSRPILRAISIRWMSLVPSEVGEVAVVAVDAF